MRAISQRLMGFGKDLLDSKISIAGQTMENKDSFKYFGIKVDKKLNLNNQTEKNCKQVLKFNGVLYRGRSCFSKQSLLKFHMAYVILI